jgi:hypothetical protein
VYAGLLAWLDKLEPGLTLDELYRRVGDAVLEREVETLREGLYGTAESSAVSANLGQLLRQARSELLNAKRGGQAGLLPLLNP